GARLDRQGVHRPAARQQPFEQTRRRNTKPRARAPRALRVPARDRVHRRPAHDHHRQGPAQGTAQERRSEPQSVKRILLIGAGHAHLTILRGLKEEALASARLALVAPRASQIYSGMLPGVIAGHYRRDEAEIDVARLAGAVSAEFIQGEVVKLDPAQKLARLADGTELEYDQASINVGALPDRAIPGAQFALSVKPHEAFYDKLLSARLNRVAIAGGGLSGAEVAMALRHRGAAVTLYSEQAELWPPALLPALRSAGVDVRPGMAVDEIERGPVVIVGASMQEFDLVLLATAAAPPAWLRGAGLPCDERGFLLVDDTLKSVAH